MEHDFLLVPSHVAKDALHPVEVQPTAMPSLLFPDVVHPDSGYQDFALARLGAAKSEGNRMPVCPHPGAMHATSSGAGSPPGRVQCIGSTRSLRGRR